MLDAIATLPDVLNDPIAFFTNTMIHHDGNDESGDEKEGNDSLSNNTILSTLQLLRVEYPTLLIPYLDAIGSLPLTEDQIGDVTRDALEVLANVEPWGLLALTSFLMNHCPSGSGKGSMAQELVEEMRKLPLGSSNAAGASGEEDEDGKDLNRGTKTNTASASSCLMIESLSRGFAHRPDLTSTLLKSIKDTPPAGYHPPADIWLLASCASAPHNRLKVKSNFKSKASNVGFTLQSYRNRWSITAWHSRASLQLLYVIWPMDCCARPIPREESWA